jgi:hypothetical protein
LSAQDADFINTCFPVVQAERYRNGCYKLIRKSLLQDSYLPAERGKIMAFSKRSLANLIFTINATDTEFHSMITLTYPMDFPANGATVKEDLRIYLQWLKRRFDTKTLWFLEFQTRGAPHFHILLETREIAPKMRIDAGMQWVSRIIEANWFTACFRNYEAGCEVEFDYQGYKTEVIKIAKVQLHEKFWELEKKQNGMRNYASKYASKMYQKKVPELYTEVGKFWGCGKEVRPKPEITFDTCEDDIRNLLENSDHKAKEWEVLPKLLFNVKR